MSNTPRTEAEVNRPHGPLDRIVTVDADFACQLERELNAANERIRRLNDYIAALETAGDEMAKELSYGYDVDMWHKAKEAKP